MSYETVQDIDAVCGEAYKLLGYLPIDSNEHLTNLSNLHIAEPSWLSHGT